MTVAFSEASDGASSDNFINLKTEILEKASTTSVDDLTLAIDTFLSVDPRSDDINLKLALTYVVKVTVLLDGGSTDTELATIATEGFDLALSVVPDDIKQDVIDIRNEIDTDLNGIITAAEVSVYTQ